MEAGAHPPLARLSAPEPPPALSLPPNSPGEPLSPGHAPRASPSAVPPSPPPGCLPWPANFPLFSPLGAPGRASLRAPSAAPPPASWPPAPSRPALLPWCAPGGGRMPSGSGSCYSNPRGRMVPKAPRPEPVEWQPSPAPPPASAPGLRRRPGLRRPDPRAPARGAGPEAGQAARQASPPPSLPPAPSSLPPSLALSRSLSRSLPASLRRRHRYSRRRPLRLPSPEMPRAAAAAAPGIPRSSPPLSGARFPGFPRPLCPPPPEPQAPPRQGAVRGARASQLPPDTHGLPAGTLRPLLLSAAPGGGRVEKAGREPKSCGGGAPGTFPLGLQRSWCVCLAELPGVAQKCTAPPASRSPS